MGKYIWTLASVLSLICLIVVINPYWIVLLSVLFGWSLLKTADSWKKYLDNKKGN